MSDFGTAFEHERAGEYRQAAAYYATAGFKKLVEEEFEPTRRSRIGTAIILRSISCVVRAGVEDRPLGLKGLVEYLARSVQDETDDEVLSALMDEWIGDLYVMLDEPEAAWGSVVKTWSNDGDM